MAGIDHVLVSIDGIKKLVVDATVMVKDGISFGDLPLLFKVLSDLKVLVDNVPDALPEIKDLDPVEAGKVTEAAYVAVKEVLAVLKPAK